MKFVSTNKRLFLVLIGTLFFANLLWGDELWSPNGIPIRQGVHVEWQKTICPGDSGTTIFVWSDTRYGSRNVFAQKVNKSGLLLWGTEGKAVTDLPGRQEDPVAIEDGAGGAFIAWVDYRFDEEGDIFLQHIDADGNPLLPLEGQELCQIPGRQIAINMCTDSLGGVFVTWQDKRNGLDEDIYGVHISSDHVLSPGVGGSPIISLNGNQGPKSIEYTGNQQAQLVWADTRDGEADVYLQRLNTDMSLVFDSTGLPVANEPYIETTPRTTFMHGDTSLVVWQEGEALSQVRYQLFNSSGAVFPMGRSVTNQLTEQTGPRVKRDRMGNVFIVWTDYRSNSLDGDAYLQKITANGALAWDSSGIAVDNSGLKNVNTRFVSDGGGGVWLFYEQGVFPDVDIRGQHYDAAGNPVFGGGGIAVSQASEYQFAPIASGDDEGGAYVVFADQQSGSIALRVQRITASGTIAFPDDGLLGLAGLDGDVDYTHGWTVTNGSVLVDWLDSRSGKTLYANPVTVEGPDTTYRNGHQISTVDAFAYDLENEPVTLFAQGWLYTALFEASTGVKHVRLQKLNAALETQWDSSGVLVYNSSADQVKAFLLETPDGVGCLWSEIRNQIDYDIYYQRFNVEGTPQLLEGGTPLVEGTWIDDYVEALFPTPDGEFLLFWVEDIWGAGVLKYQKYTLDGQISAGWPSTGYTLADVGDPENLVGAIISNSEGVLVAWEELHNFSKDIYAQIVHWDGTVQWSVPQALTTAPNDQVNLALAVESQSLTALAVWEDFRDSLDWNIYGQELDLVNHDTVGSNFALCEEVSFQSRPIVRAVGNGAYFVVWEDGRGFNNPDPVLAGGLDLYGQVVLNGENIYSADGIPLVAEYHDQKQAVLTLLDSSSADGTPVWLLHWIDLRSSGKADLANLYAQAINISVTAVTPEEPLPTSFLLGTPFPNPFNGTLSFQLVVNQLQPVDIMIYDLLGRMVWQEKIIPATRGIHRFRWSGRDLTGKAVSSGIYIYRVKVMNNIYSGKVTYLK
ncbi:MAG: T9SS type A sorting domain-containing protein [Fidelibacterota bacterium]